VFCSHADVRMPCFGIRDSENWPNNWCTFDSRKKEGFEQSHPGEKGVDAASVKSEAMRYVRDLLLSVEFADEPDVIVSRFLPEHWKDYNNLRKRNLIQLCFWRGNQHCDLQLISDLPMTRHFNNSFLRIE
jgi:hypothetical protein